MLFIGHYSNITLFYHTHTIDGVTYCHSHFYWLTKTSNPVQLPIHSKEQLKLIQDVNNITWNSDIEIPTIEKPIFTFIQEFLTPTTTPNSLAAVLYASLRAPPAIFS